MIFGDRRTLRDRILSVVFTTAIVAMIVATGVGVIVNLNRGNGGEAAAWAQACGSIVAIAGAAWLARSGERQAKRARRTRAEETAWYVRFSVVQAQFESQVIAHELVHGAEAIDVDRSRAWRQRMVTAASALRTLMSRTDYVHPAIVHVAANAVVLADEMIFDLGRLEESVSTNRDITEAQVRGIVAYHLSLADLVREYDARLRGISKVLDRGEDELPVREWLRQ